MQYAVRAAPPSDMHAGVAADLDEMPLVANSKAVVLWIDSQAVAWNTLRLHAFCDLVLQVARFVYAKLPVLSAGNDQERAAYACMPDSSHSRRMRWHKV